MAKKTAVEQRLDDLSEQIKDGFERVERSLERHAQDDKDTFGKHDGRIRTLEMSKANLSGRAAVVAFVLSLLASSVSAALVSHYLLIK